MEWKKAFDNLNQSVSTAYDNGVDRILDRMGLEQKRSTMETILPALGIFGAGIAVGAALGLLFAPKRGDQLRSDLRTRIEDLRERVPTSYEQLRHRREELAEERAEHEQVEGAVEQPGQHA